MKGNVFQTWLKEFCALVFTQTIQAFLLAIILSLIVMIYNGTSFGRADRTSATGVLAIIALTSISKMEGLVKKIFGVESSITDASMKGGKPGLMGSIMALKMAKKALNNIPQMASGAKGVVTGIRDKRSARVNYATQMAKLSQRRTDLNAAIAADQAAGGANALGSASYSNGLGAGAGSYGSGQGAGGISGGTVTITNSNVNMSGGGNSVNGGKSASALKDQYSYEDDVEKLKSEYAAKKKEANKKILDSSRSIARGGLETAGGIVGGVLGGSIGAVAAAGTGGNISEGVAKGLGNGIGVGDMAGNFVADLPVDAVKVVSAPTRAGYYMGKTHYQIADANTKIRAARSRNRALDDAMSKFGVGDI